MEIRKDYYPEDIALTLCSLSYKNFENFDEYGEQNPKIQECADALYQLMAIVENPYNKKYFRTLWETLQDFCEAAENGYIKNDE